MDEQQALLQNLTDAGCGAVLREQFISLVRQGREKEALALLTGHRRALPERCHAAERKSSKEEHAVWKKS